MLGCELNTKKYDVTIYDRNTALGRKFLVAGDGGLNITHSEPADKFATRYYPAGFLQTQFLKFNNTHLVSWLNNAGIETFVGTSGRVFPARDLKPITVLNVFLNKIISNAVKINYKHEWCGFADNNRLIFRVGEEKLKVESDIMIFCLGGASWPVTGSKGDWLSYFETKKVETKSFIASNCAFAINWEAALSSKIEGKALKNISVSCSDKVNLGEVVLTRFGIEGSGIYPLSPNIRQELARYGSAKIKIDFKPNVPLNEVELRLKNFKSKNVTDVLRIELNLTATHINLLKSFVTKEDFLSSEKLAWHIKNFELTIRGLGAIEDAISTVGGISLNAIDENFELKEIPKHYVIGEMLDYDAPTGGYLLQSCFTMAKYLADHLNYSS
jgi:uncharacterized flavoprotein (TIGR03862 family)